MIYLALGRRESGKTTLGVFIARRAPRRVIFDPRGLVRPTSTASLFVTNIPLLKSAMDALVADQVAEVIFTPSSSVQTGFEAFTLEVKRFIKQCPSAQLAILIDEIRFVDLADEDLDWILRCAPVARVHVIFTGHRPKDVPPDIRAIADRWLLFSFTLPRDLDIIEEQCSPTVARTVQTIPPRVFVSWDDRSGQATKFSDPTTWYVRLDALMTEPGSGLPDDLGLNSESLDDSELF